MRNILMHLRLVIKYVQGGGGGWGIGIKKHSFYKGLFYGTLPLFNEGWSFHFLPMENLEGHIKFYIILQKYEGGLHIKASLPIKMNFPAHQSLMSNLQ